MKSTDTFKRTISDHLDSVASNDPAFADKMKNPDKNMDQCITYILNQVKKSGAVGFADEEIFGMAMHYFDEEKIEVGKPVNAKVVVNHAVDLSQEDLAQAKKIAMDKAILEAHQQITKKSKPKKEDQPAVTQGELF